MLREKLLNQNRQWLVVITCFFMTILILVVPATILKEKSKNSENMVKLNRTALFGKVDDINEGFLQENGRIPAPSTEDKPTKDLRIYTGTTTQNMMKNIRETITNVTVISKNGTVFNGFEGPMITYNETEMLCSSEGAKMPWFEMMAGQFSDPVWIESSANFITRTINASDEIGHETLKRLMKTYLDEKSPLQLNYRLTKNTKKKFCLWPMSTVFSTDNSWDKLFVCKNETFDEQGRLILFFSKRIFCELEKLTSELVEKYQPSVPDFKGEEVNWVTRYLNTGGYARMQSGWSIFDDYEESGIPICSSSPEMHLVQQEELSLYSSRNAHSLCIYPE